MEASTLLAKHLEALRAAAAAAPVLDLACGSGRNGLWLASRGLAVVFADIRREALDRVRDSLAPGQDQGITLWQVDLEEPDSHPLEPGAFGAVLVFRYLHRPLMQDIDRALRPGGLLIYETFTTAQRKLGRPTNPDFLLEPGELPGYFTGWEILHSFEGEVKDGETGPARAIAQLVARKP